MPVCAKIVPLNIPNLSLPSHYLRSCRCERAFAGLRLRRSIHFMENEIVIALPEEMTKNRLALGSSGA